LRSQLNQIAGLARAVARHVEGLVHPQAAAERTERPRHVCFIAANLLIGSAALVVLPLHLALAGPVSAPLALALGWMLAQWPLALYLSNTGDLARAAFASACLFAGFLGGIAILTGGLSSLAVFWLMVVPLEAALSGSRKLTMAAAAVCAAILAGLALVPADLAQWSPGGSEAVFLAAICALAYGAGLATRLAGERARLATLLKTSDAGLRQTVNSTGNLLFALNDEGELSYRFGPADKVLETPARELAGSSLFARVHVQDRPLYLDFLARARLGQRPGDVELRLRRGENRPGEQGTVSFIWTELSCQTPVDPQAGDIAELLVLMRDISGYKSAAEDLKTLRDEADAASAEKTRFIAAAGHELKTPLNAILGFTDMLRTLPDQAGSKRRQREYLDLVHDSGSHMLQLLDDILDTSRIETGHLELSIETVDLKDTIKGCADLLAPQIERAGLRLETCLCTNLHPVPADPKAVRQILLNLLSNAVKFTGPGGRIIVNVKRERTFVAISIRDTGCGIPADQLPFAGQPFRRLAGAETAAGCGLGLSIVRGLTELHGGRFQIDSDPAKGTEVTVRLPAGAQTAVFDTGRNSGQVSLTEITSAPAVALRDSA